jgi:cytoskeletal protein RodZ
MKQCPACHRAYDDAESYCLMDGTLLKTERKKSGLLFLLSGFIILALIGFFGFLLLRNFRSNESPANNRKQTVGIKSSTQNSTPVSSTPSIKNQNSITNGSLTENQTNANDLPAQTLNGKGSSFDDPQEITDKNVVLKFKGDNSEQFFVFEGGGEIHISLEIKAQTQNAGATISFMDTDGTELASPVLLQAIHSGTERGNAKFSLPEKQKVIMKVASIAYGTQDAYPGTLKINFESGLSN